MVIASDSAEARRHRHRGQTRHHSVERESSSPQFSSIIVIQFGAVLSANNPDGSRHPASLTKIMTLYLLFERLDARQV